MNPKVDIKKIIDLRQKLHKFPELSGNEEKTKEHIIHFFKRFNPSVVHLLPGNSVAFEFEGKDEQAVIFRAELDALPIDEQPQLPYASANKGISHKCGHDGHMAILAGLAEAVSKLKERPYKTIFLYQSAEETLSGAVEILSSDLFRKNEIKAIIGFHNIPGYEQNAIILKPGDFTSYVTGLKVEFTGTPAHAADSASNANLLKAVTRLIQYVDKELELAYGKNGLVNITHISYGKPTFAISPSEAIIHLVIREFSNEKLDELIEIVEEQIKLIALANNLQWKLTFTEDAPSVFNELKLTALAQEIANELNRTVINPQQPFKWGEDFGFYTIKHKGLYLGIGAGTDCPPLHSINYDFPDEIILPTIEYLFNLYLSLANKN